MTNRFLLRKLKELLPEGKDFLSDKIVSRFTIGKQKIANGISIVFSGINSNFLTLFSNNLNIKTLRISDVGSASAVNTLIESHHDLKTEFNGELFNKPILGFTLVSLLDQNPNNNQSEKLSFHGIDYDPIAQTLDVTVGSQIQSANIIAWEYIIDVTYIDL